MHAINFSKLCLQQVKLKNKTDETQSIDVILHKKCPGCPRLHGTYTKNFVLEPEQTLQLKEDPHIIKVFQTQNHKLKFNVSYKKNLQIPLIDLSFEKKRDFPVHIEFEAELKDNDEYNLLIKGHEDYIKAVPEGVDPKTFFEKIKNVYKKNNINLKILSNQRTSRKKKSKISRIIHQIWFGGHPIPELFKKWQEEWKAKHPGWIFILWNEKRIKEKFSNGLHNQAIYDEARMMYDYATMSKVVRYEILYKFGGIYVDPDVRCFENFSTLHETYDFYAGFGRFYKSFGACNNGVIGSRSKHPILKRCMSLIKACETKPGGLYDWTACNLATKPFTQAIYETMNTKENLDIIFPRSYFDGNEVVKEFNHTESIYEAAYANIKHKPQAFCARGVYSYVEKNKTRKFNKT